MANNAEDVENNMVSMKPRSQQLDDSLSLFLCVCFWKVWGNNYTTIFFFFGLNIFRIKALGQFDVMQSGEVPITSVKFGCCLASLDRNCMCFTSKF